jgi:hypothetical protein
MPEWFLALDYFADFNKSILNPCLIVYPKSKYQI